MSNTVDIEIVCPDCGSTLIKRPDDFNFESNFVDVSCAACGRDITKDDVIKQVTDAAKKQAADIVRNAFKR
ncbi:ECs_2282 family putative zinc-binding protein [Atlantibacter hermannii]|uniref:ECs_2282 family putative zinc-binding protein n=1 Tax=Atlantibacter hermannii TaxID=565 RepID=UPI0028AEE3C0|nr:hypothetical protein [Atlantibacter hermannii]